MCGIVVAVSKKAYGFVYKDLQVFDQLLYADALRGDDATGIIGVTKEGHFTIDKAAIDARDFLLQYERGESRKEAQKDGVALIGHNRKATIGKHTDENAHPFVAKDRFAMVHNGTLYNHRKLHDTNVDSEALTLHMESIVNSDNYNLELMSEELAKVDGAFATVWYNQKTHKVQAIRNSQRPLWLCDAEDAWYLSSEGALLHWILVRNGVKYSKLEPIKEYNLITLSPGSGVPVVVEEVTEKKSQPASSTPAGPGTTSLGNNASKNLAKKAQRTMLGSQVTFWATDYTSRYPLAAANEEPTEILLMGETDSFPNTNHMISGFVKLADLHIKSVLELEELLFYGTISGITYDKESKMLRVSVTDIGTVPFVPNITKETNETTITLH